MALFYLLAFIFLFFGVRYRRHGFYSDNLSIEQTNAIKGFFIMFVFIGHCIQTLGSVGFAFVNVLDVLGKRIWSEFGQLTVVMFLFYSGFGVMESYQKKGQDYIQAFPRKRLLNTLLNFDIAVLCFIVLDYALGVKLSLKQIGLSFLAWKSVGNSNWYIFVILFCYFAAYLGFRLSPNNNARCASIIFLLSFFGMIALSYKRPIWWYNTLMCFPAGVYFSVYKENTLRFFQKYYFVIFFVSLGLFLMFHFMSFPDIYGIIHNMKSVLFVVTTVLFTMKVKTENAVLIWLGINVFPIYIYQRIPMLAITKLAGNSLICCYPYLFVIVCMIITVIISWGYQLWRVRIS